MAYIDDYTSALESADAKKHGAVATFFDETRSLEERLQAFETSGTFNEPAEIELAMTIFRNPKEPPALRAAALRGIVSEVGDNEALMDEVIALIRDRLADANLRNSAVFVIQSNSFSSFIFPDKKPQFNDAMRSLVDDPNESLRTTAIEYLAQIKDHYVQERLVEGLKDPSKQIIEPEVAIQLLSYDLHAEHFALLRQIVENPPNMESKKEALRNLAADSGSKDLLRKTMEDEKENPEVRHVSAVALQAQSPKVAETAAKKIILQEGADPELKTALLNTLVHTSNPKALDKDKDFKKNLKLVEEHLGSDNFKKIYEQFQAERKDVPGLWSSIISSIAAGIKKMMPGRKIS